MTHPTLSDDKIESVRDKVRDVSNAQLAYLLRLSVNLSGKGSYETYLANMREAKARVGENAAELEHDAWAAFDTKHGIEQGMSDDQLDAIFDQLSDDEIVPGPPYFLQCALMDADYGG